MDAIVIVFIVFMSFVSIMCVFAMLIVMRDLLMNRQRRNDDDEKESKPKVAPEPVAKAPDPVPQPEPVVEAVPETTPDSVDTDEVGATFVPADKKTLDEKYAELPKVYRSFYDEVAQHAEKAEGVTRHIKNDN